MVQITKLTRLSSAFKKLPGIGPKMSERIAYHILNTDPAEVFELMEALEDVQSSVRLCSKCFAPSENELCEICSNENRDRALLCVVERIEDLVAIERTKKYNGVYHILGGVIAPLDGLGPSNLKIKELLERTGSIKEVIMATNPTTEGDITANYIADILHSLNVKVTRIGYGLPMGGSLEYADEITLVRSLESRKEITTK